ncbi:hypothetical protein BO94DRAFT_152099 [Aspergillus sclerotioniger CBS 115572]|uniref:Uncharacterized protein n=1 Tax=Aspergillus sclerotioniger CBS 115572 TaxID=1450535 RepID=A0A317W2T1_9EURO|nr:hypothetical protein BO94DRAFT_152099 [Aspergillus sclerotioniger CBS 115572]PWY80896.1 hypothetical protein BO94DRAFT_152099 [Aspergillus sclerotioniger CBS 115572]
MTTCRGREAGLVHGSGEAKESLVVASLLLRRWLRSQERTHCMARDERACACRCLQRRHHPICFYAIVMPLVLSVSAVVRSKSCPSAWSGTVLTDWCPPPYHLVSRDFVQLAKPRLGLVSGADLSPSKAMMP